MEIEHRSSAEYQKWMRKLSPRDGSRVADKLLLLSMTGTNLTMPHVRRLGEGLCELRVDKYRLYFVVDDDCASFLTYGEKDTQMRDIERARKRQ